MIAMMAGVVLAQVSVADYFPLVRGMSWEYSESGAYGGVTHEEVGEPETIDGLTSYPIVQRMAGKEVGRTYYRIDSNTVYIVAYEAGKPLAVPQPILKAAEGRTTWEFTGQSYFLNEPVDITMKATAVRKLQMMVLGEKRDAIEVKYEGQVGKNVGTALRVNQVAYYAKGIGLVEMTSENIAGKQKSKSQLKLLKFTPAKQP
jgi:hypothetical protein